jgi:hypothetical protein
VHFAACVHLPTCRELTLHKGFGYESEAAYEPCKLTFLNIHNIHVVRESMQRLRDLCAANIDDQKWLTNLENTQWLKHIRVRVCLCVSAYVCVCYWATLSRACFVLYL